MTNKIAGAVFSFKRAEYLKQVLKSLNEAEGSSDIDWYAYQDGGFNEVSQTQYATDEEIAESMSVIENGPLDFKETYESVENVCIGVQKDFSHFLFDSYEKVFFFEDDMIVGKHYLKLLDIATNQFPDATVVMNAHPSNREHGNFDRLVKSGIARIWGYGMTNLLYRRIEKEYKNFAYGISHTDYMKRHQMPNVRRKYGMRFYSHDKAISILSREHGRKLRPVISRGYYIGREGNIAYRTDKTWFKRGMDTQDKKITHPEDETLERFVLK